MNATTPQVAARNNMDVWRDKCLKGSLRVARPGELSRKIVDLVSDDQDCEPESVVHTHLCILLAEGDDLELKRPRMFSGTTPHGALSQVGFNSEDNKVGGLKHSKSLGNLDSAGSPLNADGTVDLAQVNMVNGTPKLRARSSTGVGESDGQMVIANGGSNEELLVRNQHITRVLVPVHGYGYRYTGMDTSTRVQVVAVIPAHGYK